MVAIESKTEALECSLNQVVVKKVMEHLLVLDDRDIVDLYKLVMDELGAPLYENAIECCENNQSPCCHTFRCK